MKKVTAFAKTVEEAVAKALHQLQATREQVHIRIIEEPSKGLFGIIGSKPAVVEVEMKVDPIEEGKKFLKSVMIQMGVDGFIEVFKREEGITLNIVGNDVGVLIGHHGQTLDALQNLVNAVVNKYTEQYTRVYVDAENYRQKRIAALEQLAERLARKVARTKQNIKLEPMTAHERKIIHTYLQNDPYVETYSEGEEPRRYLVIAYKRK